MIYLISSLRNPRTPLVADQIRRAGFEVFDQWYASGERADDAWRDYAKARGWTLKQALKDVYAKHIFDFDSSHLARADVAVLLMPCGKSGFLELGIHLGRGKPGYILLEEEPERFDQMFQFADDVCISVEELIWKIKELPL